MTSEIEPEDPTGMRYYGSDMTIHQTGHINVETDTSGRVVAVWFRCQPLRWDQTVVDESRAEDMRNMYQREMPAIEALVLQDKR